MNDEQKQLVTKLIDELSILRSGLNHTARQALDRLANMTGPANALHESLVHDLNVEEHGEIMSGAVQGGPPTDDSLTSEVERLEAERNKAAEQSMLEQRDSRVVNEQLMADVDPERNDNAREDIVTDPPPPADPVVIDPPLSDPPAPTTDPDPSTMPDSPSVPRKSGRKHQH